MLRVVVMGSGDLCQAVLRGIVDSPHQIVGVYPWERKRNTSFAERLKRRLVPDNLALVRHHNLHEIRARDTGSAEFLAQVSALRPDVLMVSSWGELLGEEVIALPRKACINVHPSLLPAHRGSAPVSSVLRHGETQTGVTFHSMTSRIDAGDILLQSTIAIDMSDNGASLSRKIAFRARELVGRVLDGIETATLAAQPQDASRASYFPRARPHEARVDWGQPAYRIHNQVRGFYPWTPAYTFHHDNRLALLSSSVVELAGDTTDHGRVLQKCGTHLLVSTSDRRHAIVVDAIGVGSTFTQLRGKLYALRKIRIGDVLDR